MCSVMSKGQWEERKWHPRVPEKEIQPFLQLTYAVVLGKFTFVNFSTCLALDSCTPLQQTCLLNFFASFFIFGSGLETRRFSWGFRGFRALCSVCKNHSSPHFVREMLYLKPELLLCILINVLVQCTLVKVLVLSFLATSI